MKKLKSIYVKYRHGIPLLIYMVIYLSWFAWLEATNKKNYSIIHVTADDYIPFCEIFVVPYLLWFAYVSAVVLFLFFRNKQEFYRSCVFLFTGMTIFLIISTLWPNGHHLRLAEMPRENIFTRAVSALWQVDTPTNIWPSIHVYNSLGAHLALIKTKGLSGRKWLHASSFVLSLSIILSTMFIKQHSVFDVVTAFIMAAFMYGIVYKYDILTAHRAHKEKARTRTPQIN